MVQEQTIYEKKWIILSAVMIGSIMTPIDGSIINMAMPTLSKIFNAPLSTISWVSMAYLLIVSSTLLAFGRIGDIWGYRNLFLGGLFIFTLGSAFCGFSTSIFILILGRVIQAIGGGMLMSMAPAILTAVFPPNERGKALGINAMSIAVGLAIGPGLGGLLISMFGWEYIFFINLPVGAIALFWAYRILPFSKKNKNERFDVFGAILAFILLFALLMYINRGGQWGWVSFTSIIVILFFAISIITFIFYEKKHPEPMLDLSLFRIRLFTLGNISTLLNFSAQFIMTFLTPFYLQEKGLSTSLAGTLLMTFPLVMLAMAPISGILSDRFGSRGLSTLGAVISATGIFLMTILHLDSPNWQIALNLAIFGIGNGLFQSPNNSSVMGSVPKGRLGVTSSFLATMRNVGMVLGIAIGGAVFTNLHQYFLTNSRLNGSSLEGTAFMNAIRIAYLTGVCLDIICAVASATRGKHVHVEK